MGEHEQKVKALDLASLREPDAACSARNAQTKAATFAGLPLPVAIMLANLAMDNNGVEAEELSLPESGPAAGKTEEEQNQCLVGSEATAEEAKEKQKVDRINLLRRQETALASVKGAGTVDFEGFTPAMAEAVSGVVRQAGSQFPGIELRFIGTIENRLSRIERDLTDYYWKKYKRERPSFSEAKAAGIAAGAARQFMDKAGIRRAAAGKDVQFSSTPASSDPGMMIVAKYDGIAFSGEYVADDEKREKKHQEKAAKKESSAAAASPRYLADYGIGLALDALVGASAPRGGSAGSAGGDEKIHKLHQEFSAEADAPGELSSRAKDDVGAFVAECYAEFRNKGNYKDYPKRVFYRLKALYYAKGNVRPTVAGVGRANFSGFSESFEEAAREAFEQGAEEFPGLSINLLATFENRVSGMERELTEYFAGRWKRKYPSFTQKRCVEKGKEDALNFIKDNNLKAEESGTMGLFYEVPKEVSTPWRIVAKYSGISTRSKHSADEKIMKDEFEQDEAIKSSPVGAASPRYLADHEIGHAIDAFVGASNDLSIKTLFETFTKELNPANELCSYAATNIGDFIAESYAEVRNNKEPREYAKIVYRRLQELYMVKKQKEEEKEEYEKLPFYERWFTPAPE